MLAAAISGERNADSAASRSLSLAAIVVVVASGASCAAGGVSCSPLLFRTMSAIAIPAPASATIRIQSSVDSPCSFSAGSPV